MEIFFYVNQFYAHILTAFDGDPVMIHNLTHRVAANAYTLFEDKFLILRRANPPKIWVPPGGHLHLNEDPLMGLAREVYEETAIRVRVIQPVHTWFGVFRGSPLLSIDYVCEAYTPHIKMSREHTQFRWLTIPELARGESYYFNSEEGFKLNDFIDAWNIHVCNETRFDEYVINS
jgi:8-oxo-dGTP diphosphatase